MKDLLVAERYAQALFDIVRLTHQDEEVEAQLESFSAALKQDADVEKYLTNPHVKALQKRKLLQRIYQERDHQIYKTLVDFFTILIEKNRFYLIHEITARFKRIADEAQGQGVAEIQSAVPLAAQAEARIVAQLERLAGYKITVKKTVDPSLIGGVVVRIKNRILDGSVRHKIELFKKELTKVAAI